MFGIDTTQVGQALLGLIFIVGYAAQHLQGRHMNAKAQEIHILVNSQKTELEKRIATLEEALSLANGEKPE